ncbi:MAG: endonuclease/exonuclease/phosphatase family protein [Muribaculaceae bacterium]|nr:endonuclease/exonuclease/phosphatase family protein [Muribaculaceae bacterium]
MKRFLSFIALIAIFSSAYAVVPEVVAHRGYHRAPGSAENSIRALVKADSIGAEKCEFDVWLSADDVLYVNHNSDVNGVVIETSKSKDIDACRLKNGERVPRLEAFLDTAKNLGIDLVLEVKPHKDTAREDVAVPMIIKMVAEKGLTERTSYISFSRHACEILARDNGRPVLFLSGIAPLELKAMGCTGADFNISVFRNHPDWIEQIHALGMPVNIWTVDKEEDIQYCIDKGADFITTNEPELAQKLIDQAYAPRKLKIMSYNLRFGELASMERLANEIKEQNPDFVALQEVDVNSLRTMAKHNNNVHFVNELAMRTGLFGFYGRTLNFPDTAGVGRYYGVAILSRHPAVKIETLELPNPKNVEPRVVLKGRFLLDGKMPFNFASTHFDYLSAETQERQANYLVEKLMQDSIPTVVAGDFNSEPGSNAITALSEHAAVLSGTNPTFPAKEPNVRLDHIFGFPTAAFILENTQEGPAGPHAASDHLPVISSIIVDFGSKDSEPIK